MVEGAPERRLTVIVAIDVAGYSRLMGNDEEGKLAALNAHPDTMMPMMADHGGRLVSQAGDGLLLEFSSVVQAVKCAMEMQAAMAARNAHIPDKKKMAFRMGINLGDVLVDGDDIFGDGVNVAARIEALAEPGGICISRTVRDNVRDRLDVALDDMGDVAVKNIARPVRVFRVLADAQKVSAPAKRPSALKASLATAALVLAVAAAGGAWWWQTSPYPASHANTTPTFSGKPSIAVLPFNNMSGDPGQDHFADGMTEDLITDLSKVSGLFVVARNSSFAYKGKSMDIRAVAAELGVRYVLEGSIRKLGDQVRINAQLIDARSGGHMWAERYDGPVDNVFKIQDEIGTKVVAALSVKLTRGEADRMKHIHTNNTAAYELFLRARAASNPPIPERIKSDHRMFQRVVEMDPEFAGGYAGVSAMLGARAMWGYGDVRKVIEQAEKMARKAIAVDAAFGWSYISLGRAMLARKQYGNAIAAAREAIARQPNDADSYVNLAVFLGMDGQYVADVAAAN